ncbi:hypothetical protein BH23BAC4_BH23BAC4_04430 [soil metagenome]
MPTLVSDPTVIPVPGGKLIEEFVGRARTGHDSISVAHMIAPPRWDEPYQTPSFDEVTIVVRGVMRVQHIGGHTDVDPGQTILCVAGERIRYSNPSETEECEYWAVCTPAFSPEEAGRE